MGPALGVHEYNSEKPPLLSLGAGAARALAQHGAELLEHEGWLFKLSTVPAASAASSSGGGGGGGSGSDGAPTKTKTVLRRRWYFLQQNFLYWYSNHTEGQPRGVLFLEGSYVKPVSDEAREAVGYFPLCIHTSSEHGDRVRVLYANGREQREEWLTVLRRACRASPFEDDFEIARELGRGKFSIVYEARRRNRTTNTTTAAGGSGSGSGRGDATSGAAAAAAAAAAVSSSSATGADTTTSLSGSAAAPTSPSAVDTAAAPTASTSSTSTTSTTSSDSVAVKVIAKSELSDAERELLRTEIAILKLVAHPHIIRLENVYETGSHMYIAMELLEGGELFTQLVGRARFTEAEAKELARPLADALGYLHSLGIVHRDIKPQNLLCTGAGKANPHRPASLPFGDIKIADFGLSKLVHPSEVMTMPVGTLHYCAPEVLRQSYSASADLWSLGVLLYLVVRGHLPFDGSSQSEVVWRICNAELDFTHPVWAAWSPEGLDFVQGLLQRDPSKRLTARRALQHPWLRSSSELPHRLPPTAAATGGASATTLTPPAAAVAAASAAAAPSHA